LKEKKVSLSSDKSEKKNKKTIMKNILLLLSLLFSNIIFSQSNKQIFSSPNLKEAVGIHKTVAVLPFKASISYKQLPKNFNPETNKQEEKKLAQNLQIGIYTYLLRKSNDYSVVVQDIERTNILLKQNNMDDKLDEFTADQLAKILGVDAVIKCSYAYEKTHSEASAILADIFLWRGSVASATLTMGIYDGKDGTLLWRFTKEMNEHIEDSANGIMESQMKKIGRNFPYVK
jgi:hypothetical protein